jgi:hypothetical protein
MERLMRLVVLVLGIVLALALAAPAQAACEEQTFEQPFLRFLDPMRYTLAPGGSFEDGAPGWKLTGGASVVAGNETYHVGGRDDAHSLYLPSGSSATTPPICVELDYPTLRFFAANRGSVLLSTLKVDVILLGLPVPIGVVAGGSAWQPTLPMLVVKNLLAPLARDGSVDVRFRFTPVGLGAKWQIDDVYVDPTRNR